MPASLVILPGLAEALQAVTPLTSKTVQTEEQLEELVQRLNTSNKYALDTETTSLNTQILEIVGFSVAFNDRDSWYVPLGHLSLDRQLPTVRVLNAVKPALERRDKKILFHHAKYDISVFKKYGINIPMITTKEFSTFDDSMIMAWILDVTRPKGLKYLAKSLLGFQMNTFASLFSNKNNLEDDEDELEDDLIEDDGSLDLDVNFSKLAVTVASKYAKDDARATYALNDLLWKQLQNEGMVSQYLNELRLIPSMVHMNFAGVLVDQDLAKQKYNEVQKEVLDLDRRIKDLLLAVPSIRERVEARRYTLNGIKKSERDNAELYDLLNLGSNKLKQEIFFSDLGVGDKTMPRTKKGAFSTGRWALQALVRKGTKPKASEQEKLSGQVCQLLLKYVKKTKLVSGFLKPLATQIIQGRIYTNFNNVGTKTGRLSASSPNMMNIPREKFRDIFIVPPGYRWVCCDLSQVELRLAASFSGDENMCNAYRSGIDIHTVTAILMSGQNPEDFIGGTNSKAWLALSSDKRKEANPEDYDGGEKSKAWLEIRVKAKCFHPDTEVLTRQGWKRITDLVLNEEIIQAWPEMDGRVWLEWTCPWGRFSKPNNHNHLIHLKNEGIDLRVTPDHRMLAWHDTGIPYTTTPEKLIKAKHWANAGLLLEGNLEVNAHLLRLAVATQADGSYDPSDGIRFAFTKQRKIKRLRSLLESAAIPWTEGIDSRGMTRIYIRKQYTAPIKALLDNKTFPWWYLELTADLRKVILDEVTYWDSHLYKSTMKVEYGSTKQQNTEVLQALATLNGRKTRKYVELRYNKQDFYSLVIKRRGRSRGSCASITREPYTGEVVCLSVESSFILVRDRGVPVVTGNCLNFGLLYGMGGEKLYWTLINNYDVDPENISIEECEEMVKKFWNSYPGINNFQDKQHRFAEANKFVTTITGRKRPLRNCTDPGPKPLFGSNNSEERAKKWVEWKLQNQKWSAELRRAVNTPIQGCLDGNTRILTKERGYQPIRESVGEKITIWDGTHYVNARVVASGKHRKVRVTFWCNTYIECSLNHRFLCMDAHLKRSWKTARRITSLDYVVLSDAADTWEALDVRFEGGLRYDCSAMVKSVEVTDECVEMFDVMDSDSHQFMANGFVVHNSAADLIKVMMIFIHRQIESGKYNVGDKLCKMLLQVHDELNFECPEETAELLLTDVQRCMTRVGEMYGIAVPIVGSGAAGDSWDAAK